MQLSKKLQSAVEDIFKRQNGWPVGIWIPTKTAEELVGLGLAEYAVPCYQIDKANLDSVRLTTSGEFYAKNPDWCEHLKVKGDICQRCKQQVFSNPHYRPNETGLKLVIKNR